MDTADKFALAVNSQAARANDPDITDRVCGEIKNSVIFQYNWQDLLQSAPVAISATGACYVACFSEVGMRVQLDPPSHGTWKYLNDKSLAANLVRCGDLGRSAFMEAEVGLLFVKDASGRAQNKVLDIIDCIQDPIVAKKLLKPQMNQLKVFADDCYEKVVGIDKKFDEWLMYTSELHAACVGTESSDSEKLKATEIGLVVEQARFDSQKNSVTDAKAMVDKLGKSLDVASEAFKKASDEFPTGWDIMGQQIVGSLAECATTALSQFATAYTSNLNPMTKVTQGVSMFGDLIHGKQGGQNGTTNGANGTDAAAAPPQPPLQKQPVPRHASDAAYSNVQKDMPYLDQLYSILNKGPENGVNWDEASGETGKEAKSIMFLVSMLSEAQSAFRSQSSGQPPSVKLVKILSEATSISEAIQKEAENGRKMGKKFPAADSETVKDWQARFNAEHAVAVELMGTARSLPGTSPQGMPTMSDGPDPAVQIAQTNAKSAQAQAVLQSATNRLTTTQDTFQKTGELYLQSSKLLLEQENKLTAINAQLKKLNEEKMGLTEIKAVLESCIKLIVNVKQNIINLCTFFKGMSATIEAIVKYTVGGFLSEISAELSDDGNDNYKTFKIGDYTYSDHLRTTVFQGAVTVRGHFSVFGDIARMWGQLSVEYVMPGVKMLNQLATAEADLSKRQKTVADLSVWAEASVAGVRNIAKKTQDDIMEGMTNRISELQSVTKKLEPSDALKLAIQAGTTVTKDAAADALESNAAVKPIMRKFGGTRVAV